MLSVNMEFHVKTVMNYETLGSMFYHVFINSFPPDMRFSNVFINIFTKVTKQYISGLMFSHVFIDIFLPDMRFPHGFINS